jgi:hypothetical protein
LEGFSSEEVNGFKAVKDEEVEDAGVEDSEVEDAVVELVVELENGLDNPLVKEDKVDLALEVLESTVCFICPGILLSSSV